MAALGRKHRCDRFKLGCGTQHLEGQRLPSQFRKRWILREEQRSANADGQRKLRDLAAQSAAQLAARLTPGSSKINELKH